MIMIRINLTISIRNFYGAINRKLNSTWFKHKRAIYWLSFQTTSELVVPHIRLIQHFHFVIKRFTFSVLLQCESHPKAGFCLGCRVAALTVGLAYPSRMSRKREDVYPVACWSWLVPSCKSQSCSSGPNSASNDLALVT